MPYGNQKGPSLADLIIATLFSARSTKIFRDILRERERARFREESIRTRLSDLRRKGYVRRNDSGWQITEAGRKYFQEKQQSRFIKNPFDKSCEDSLVVAFDIPERKRKIRNWLREQLKIFNYKMLQQSLWLGPGPLPPEFLERLENLSIRKNLKTFKVKKLR